MPNFPSSIKKIIIETHPNIYGEALQELVINKILDENFKIYEQIGNSYSLIREGEIN